MASPNPNLMQCVRALLLLMSLMTTLMSGMGNVDAVSCTMVVSVDHDPSARNCSNVAQTQDYVVNHDECTQFELSDRTRFARVNCSNSTADLFRNAGCTEFTRTVLNNSCHFIAVSDTDAYTISRFLRFALSVSLRHTFEDADFFPIALKDPYPIPKCLLGILC